MKLSIEKQWRIRRSDTDAAMIWKILHIAREMNYYGMRIKAMQWLLKLASWMTLCDAYTAVTTWEE